MAGYRHSVSHGIYNARLALSFDILHVPFPWRRAATLAVDLRAMSGLLVRVARSVLRNPFLKRLARAVVGRVPFLRRRAQALLAQGALHRTHYSERLPVTPGDLSPRTARCLAELERARKELG